MAGERKKWPGESDEAHPEVFTVPRKPFSGVLKPGQLTEEQFRQYWEEGFVVVPDILPPDDLEPLKSDISELVDNLAQKLYKHGKIKSLYEEYGFYERLLKMEEDFEGANILIIKQGALTTHMKKLIVHERLLNVAEQLLGTSDIMFNPIFNLRPKTPKNADTTVPWHQDSSYLDTDSYSCLIVSAWIPLLNATKENGCLQFVRKGHRAGRMARHTCCYKDTLYAYVDEKEMEKTLGVNMETDVVTCEVPYGGVLFFSNIIPHRSLTTLSKEVRWSVDLRWNAKDNNPSYFGVVNGLQVRNSTDPNMKVDWEPFEGNNRYEAQKDVLTKGEDEFDTTIKGHWMKQWEIVHHNRHTEGLV